MILIQQVQTPHYTCSIQSLRGPNEYHHVLMYCNSPLVYIFLKCMLRTYDTILTVHFCLCTDNTVFLNNDIILQRFLARLLPMVLYRQLHSFHHLIICFWFSLYIKVCTTRFIWFIRPIVRGLLLRLRFHGYVWIVWIWLKYKIDYIELNISTTS